MDVEMHEGEIRHRVGWLVELDPATGLGIGGFSRTRLGARFAAWRRRRLLTAS